MSDARSHDIQALRARLESTRGREYWRSLEAVAETPEFRQYLHREFPENASEWLDPVGRRSFLKLMGASLALAGVSACTRQPDEIIVPYVRQPEEVVPGKPLFFATAMPLGGSGLGLLVESHEGRPTKIEGNPDHPSSRGATDMFAQAAVLGLYDPDRSQIVTNVGEIQPYGAFVAAMRGVVTAQQGKQGAGFRILTETVASPTLAAQIQEVLTRMPMAKWHQWEPAGRHTAREGSRMAFGEYVDAQYAVETADVILSLDADFLCAGPGGVRYARAFASRRRLEGDASTLNRLYAVESTPTNTGTKADHRLPMRASEIEGFARAVAAQLGVGGAGPSSPPEAASAWIAPLAKDLQANRGRSLVLAGDAQPPAVHALVHAMNQALGNVGQTVSYTQTAEVQPSNQLAGLQELTGEMNAGAVDFLLILGPNPVYTAPSDLKFAEALQKVALRAHLGLYEDETAALCQWHVPEAHFLEAWGDVRAEDGTVAIIQPLIAPLYQGRSAYEVLAAFSDRPERSGYDIVREYWAKASGLSTAAQPAPAAAPTRQPAPTGAAQPAPTGTAPPAPSGAAQPAPTGGAQAAPAGGAQVAPTGGAQVAPSGPATFAAAPTPPVSEFDRAWRKWLHDGLVPNTAFTPKPVSVQRLAAGDAPSAAPQGLEVVFRPDPTIYDGRFANNAWLQETPKPLTKLTWDNAALISPMTAERLRLVSGDIVELTQGGRSVRLPVWINPGHAPDSLTLHLGYGRTRAGRAGSRTGFDVNPLRTMAAPFVLTGVELTKTNDRYDLACTQDHWSLEGRNIVRVATRAEFEADPKVIQHMEHLPLTGLTMYPDYKYEGYAWGMAIDQNVCTGCTACVVACTAENNIPVVGKDQVLNGREMHWLRVDRYYTGDIENPGTYHQPMPCQQCEQAPCEVVCPVAATVHSDEGLNDMVYNRCVGTRYCSNNCPYKVRRFNFLLYQDFETPSLKLLRNPDVTVRSRGVMEKCTYCVQRINHARADSIREDRRIADGEVLTACQSACPTDAIVFGDINDPKSRVSQVKRSPLNYALLAELNTRPRTTYLGIVRNPNTELEPAAATTHEAGH
jgi:molybdopterin-containing oxidoreductase family iron-sulfur binding subunit